MEYNEKIALTEKNIREAIRDYWTYTSERDDIRDDISTQFIHNLAVDSVNAKQPLRDMLRKSPAWNEELDAVVINGNMTHDPNWALVRDLATTILYPAYNKAHKSFIETLETKYAVLKQDIDNIISYFSSPNMPEQDKEEAIASMNRINDRAYAPGKKPSRVFKALCDALGVTDESANSDFQRNFAKFADEISAKKINFKLFLSINPAHFITMSNPKMDSRGSCLTSCHSFNCTDYEYNGGCTGYARDGVTMIAFTVSNPSNRTSLNNRKTTRQLFMYEPGNGLLLQSRMYNTSGGTTGAQEESGLYRALVQQQISLCENAINRWKTSRYCDHKRDVTLYADDNFGGYADWEYEEYDPIISVRRDHLHDCHEFTIGAAGLCIACGDVTEPGDGLYCGNCKDGKRCEACGNSIRHSEESYSVTNADGEQITVCEDCLDRYYSHCEDCEEYVHESCINHVYDSEGRGRWVCDDCLDRNYTQCDECGEYYENTYEVTDEYGNEIDVCQQCMENKYCPCDDCEDVFHPNLLTEVHDDCGYTKYVCDSCLEYYEKCEECEEYYPAENMKDGLCPNCAAEKENNNENEEKEVA